MATATPTGGGVGGGGAPAARETRAIEAAAAGPVFRTPTMARVEQQSQKVADRWAPDGAAAEKQQPSLRSLGFADRMIVSYLGGGSREPAREEPRAREQQGQGAQTAGTPARSDEGRERAESPSSAQGSQPARADATPPARSETPPARSETRPRQPIGSAQRGAGAIDRPVPSVSWLFPTPWFEDELHWAAAAKAATRESERAAARTGETASRDTRPSRDAMTAVRPSSVGVPLELVAPSMAAPRPTERVQGEQARPGLAARPSPVLRAYSPLIDPAAARAGEMLAGMARREAAQARKQASGDDAAPRPAPILEFVAPADVGANRQVNAQTTAAAQRTLDPVAARPAAEKPAVQAADAKPVAPKAEAQPQPEPKKPEPRPQPATASQMLASSALSREPDRVVPAAGPRVMLPAGLGGLYAANQAARSLEQPVARTEARAAAPTPAAPMVGRERPAALDHLVWSDRWLARFAGASAPALKTFDIARTPVAGATAAASGMSSWEPAWVKPPPVRTERSEPEARPRQAPEMVVQARTGGAVDESEPVSDADFGAIAAAAAADRHNAATRARASAAAAKPQQPKPAPRTEQPVAKAQPPAPSRAPAADRALDHVKPSRTPGLGASLGASPVAPLLANLVDTPKQPAFDARQMSAATLATLPAVTAGRGAGALRELASRAPGEVFVAQAEAEKKRKQDAALAEKRPAPVVVAEKPRVQPAPKPIAAAPERKPAPAPVAPPVPDAARPGNIGSGAEAFAQKRTLAASDLSLDFLSPEVLQAARAYGFGPIDAARAQRLAASGRPRITDLASQVDQVFVSALSAPPAAAARTAAKPEPPVARDEKKPEPALAKQPVAPQPQPQQPLREAAPLRTPRGAFLLPEASARALGVSGKGAEEARPDIRFALDLVAAGHVADAATSRAAPPDTKAPASAASERPPALPVLARERGEDDRRDPNEARALLPRELWPVFDVVFLSLGESSSSGADGRPLAPAARAARALALTSKSRDGGDLPLSARARAAAAWAVLPTVIHGGPGRDRDRSGATPGATAARAPTARPVVSGDTPRFEAPRIDTTLRAGESLGSLVAPSFYEADGNRGLEDRPRAQQAQARMQSQSSREMPSTPVVQTGATPQQQRQAEPPPRQEPAPAPRPTQPRHYSSQPTPPGGDVPAWFQDAARKYLGDSGAASGGMSLAELTLVTAAPATQVAASSTRADRPVSQAESTSSSGAAGGSSPAAQQAETKADIDKIAQEVFEQICRMLEVARERSGDPWQR